MQKALRPQPLDQGAADDLSLADPFRPRSLIERAEHGLMKAQLHAPAAPRGRFASSLLFRGTPY
jgi:hypothetical protein